MTLVDPLCSRGNPPQFCLGNSLCFLGPAEHAGGDASGRIRVLNREVHFATEIDWDIVENGPIWSYHLHQMDWLRSEAFAPAERLRILLDWVNRHRRGPGWASGPASLRIFSWVKMLATSGALPADTEARSILVRSLADQLTTLAANLETHILANHYLWNLLALVFGGMVIDTLESASWLAHSRHLARELDEQFGSDGAHYEGSAMYHSQLLENILDLLNVVRAAPERAPSGLDGLLTEKAEKALGALEVWTHPDGQITQFGDSSLALAVQPSDLQRYAAFLGLAPRSLERDGVLEAVGYVRIAKGPFSLLTSVSGPSPSYQPGHAHCDALSFELSVCRQRVVTDTGAFGYLPGPEREFARGTAAHATVEIDGQNQAEIWESHRIGGRPRVALVECEPNQRIVGTCTGWYTPHVEHRRSFTVSSDCLILTDSFSGPTLPIRYFLPLASNLDPLLKGSRVRLHLAEGMHLAIELPQAAVWKVEHTPCFPEFGVRVERPSLVGIADTGSVGTWRFSLDG